MVSQRQRLARKRFKEEHQDLFPKQEQNPSTDSSEKKKKKKTKFKRKQSETKGPKTLGKNPKKSALKRRPLRVPGLKPGDCCFICKAKDHIAKLCPEKAQWERSKVCLLCRQRGHTLKRCPNKTDETMEKMCYNCGKSGHSLFNCSQPLQDGGTKFASCFICKEQGHLSKNCPKNTHGVYPKGGCCKICGGVTHLAKDCPEKGKKAFGYGKSEENEDAVTPRGRVTKFVSGDDLEDDFTMDDHQPGDKKSSKTTTKSKDGQIKLKHRQGSKVVNFTG